MIEPGDGLGHELGHEEELPQSHRREHPGLRRASGPVLVLIVIGAIVAAIVTVRGEPDVPDAAHTATRTVSRPAPTTRPAPTARPSSISNAPQPLETLPDGPAPGDPAACPATGPCQTLGTVPPVVLQALRMVFPDAKQTFASTVVAGPRRLLHFRQLNAGARGARIFLQVREPDHDTLRAFEDDDGHERHLYVQTRSHGYLVELYIVLTRGDVLPNTVGGLRSAMRLAADARLLATR